MSKVNHVLLADHELLFADRAGFGSTFHVLYSFIAF